MNQEIDRIFAETLQIRDPKPFKAEKFGVTKRRQKHQEDVESQQWGSLHFHLQLFLQRGGSEFWRRGREKKVPLREKSLG